VLANQKELTGYGRVLSYVIFFNLQNRRDSLSRWPCGLRRRSTVFLMWARGFESRWVHTCSSVVSVRCCACSSLWRDWSLVQRVLPGVHLTVHDPETSTVRRVRPELGYCVIEKEKSGTVRPNSDGRVDTNRLFRICFVQMDGKLDGVNQRGQ